MIAISVAESDGIAVGNIVYRPSPEEWTSNRAICIGQTKMLLAVIAKTILDMTMQQYLKNGFTVISQRFHWLPPLDEDDEDFDPEVPGPHILAAVTVKREHADAVLAALNERFAHNVAEYRDLR